MAQAHYEDFGGPDGYARLRRAVPAALGAGRMQRIVNAAGALTSIALVLGLATWGYRLAVRDVTGIPVIRALAGPARVAPDDPGGELARHQGLAVNAIAAEGEAAAPADRLVLAPKPIDLSADDLPMGAMPAQDNAAAAIAEAEGRIDTITASAEAGGQGLPSADVAVSEPIVVIPADVPGVAVSPRPRLRPGSEGQLAPAAMPADDAGYSDPVAEAAAEAVAAALAPAAELDVDPATLVAGTRLVQLGTYATPEEARADWDRIAALFAPLLDDKGRVVEPAESGGSVFFRLRATGFEDIDDARRFCAVLEEKSATCVPATAR